MAPHIPHPHLHSHHHSPSSPSSASPKGARYAATLDSARRLALFTHPSPALAKGALNPAAAQQLVDGGGGGGATLGPAGGPAAAAHQGGMDWTELLRKFRKHNPAREVTAAAAHVEHLVHTHLSRRTDSLATSLAASASSAPPPPSLPPLVPTSHRGAILPALDALASAISSAAPGSEADSARAVLAWARCSVGQPGEARQVLAGLQSKGRLPAQSEVYDLTLTVLATAVEGYLAEDAHSPDAALTAYSHASTLYAQALPSSSADDISLHRIGAHALFRLCVLAPSSTQAHTQYLDRCSSAPRLAAERAFPTAERLWVHRALRQLVSSGSAGPSVEGGAIARSHRAEEALIRRGTSLPPAGETNAVYLRFLDEVVTAWRARGLPRSEAGEVIEILYSALSHTFQSHLLLRHLIRALSIAGRHLEAAKALRLYRDLWDKARETDAKEVAREMRVLRARAWKEARAAGGAGEGEGVEKEKERGVERSGDEDGREEGPYDSDIDSDRAFVDTALFGVRLLCRAQVGEPGEAVALARRARAVFDEARDEELRADKEAEARIETALGVALGALAGKEASPERRPAQHEEALNHLSTAVTLSPSSFAAHYALAFQLLELRQVSSALEAARTAVERNKRSREAWHLLALCVSAQKDMRGALEVLETALDIDDDGARDVNERWDRPTDETERLAVEMQLRLTKGAVVEYLEGAPAALADQQDVLAFFSSAYSRISDAPRGSAPPPAAVAAGAAAIPTSSRPTRALAPPIPLVDGTTTDGASHKLGRTASIVSRRRSLKRQSVAVNGNGNGAHPDSVNGSLANLSLAESSPAPATSSRLATDGNALATKLLVDTWLASAASFRRARLYDEARGALGEAQQLDADDVDVWSQTALLHLGRGDVAQAREALTKGLSFDPAHVPSRVLLARVYLSAPAPSDAAAAGVPYSAAPPPPPSHLTSPVPPPASPRGGLALSLPLAEALLSTLTAHGGWDVPEAWAELARCYRLSEPRRTDKERECLVWALQLEETRPVRPLARAVERAL
ncbi:hypothetical protein JCM9279_006890 [Rhodotorula babjevae]